jgi:hypothetical protein
MGGDSKGHVAAQEQQGKKALDRFYISSIIEI